jgi:hypothetical protein
MAQEPRQALLATAAAGAGVLLGWIGARVLFVGSALSLAPWALVGLALGVACRSRRGAAAAGAVFGFALTFTFMATGYEGAAPLGTRLVPFAAIGLFGSLCGLVLTIAGLLGRRAVSRAADASRHR